MTFSIVIMVGRGYFLPTHVHEASNIHIKKLLSQTDLPEYDQRFLFKNRIIAAAYNPVTFLMTVLSH